MEICSESPVHSRRAVSPSQASKVSENWRFLGILGDFGDFGAFLEDF
jgi:hypothetical protein